MLVKSDNLQVPAPLPATRQDPSVLSQSTPPLYPQELPSRPHPLAQPPIEASLPHQPVAPSHFHSQARLQRSSLPVHQGGESDSGFAESSHSNPVESTQKASEAFRRALPSVPSGLPLPSGSRPPSHQSYIRSSDQSVNNRPRIGANGVDSTDLPGFRRSAQSRQTSGSVGSSRQQRHLPPSDTAYASALRDSTLDTMMKKKARKGRKESESNEAEYFQQAKGAKLRTLVVGLSVSYQSLTLSFDQRN